MFSPRTFHGRKGTPLPTPLSQLAQLVHGQLLGDGATPIHAARALGEARTGDISFVESPKYLESLQKSSASAVVIPLAVENPGVSAIRVADPLAAFVAIVNHFRSG